MTSKSSFSHMKTLNKDKKYLIAVSGGSDSMALLDYCHNAGFFVMAAHVNYHHRDSAFRDQKIVEDYCRQYQIPCFVLNAVYPEKGNFEAWAREIRYDFFRDLVKKNRLDAVLVAHHRDDHLETYLLQKESGRIPLVYGLKEKNRINGLTICRPFLHKTKQELIDYCKENRMEYGEDETNYDMSYSRNRIRRDLSEYSEEEKDRLEKEIREENRKLTVFYKETKKIAKCLKTSDLTAYRKSDLSIRLEAMRGFLISKKIDARHFTQDYLKELDDILNKDKNYLICIQDRVFSFSYGTIRVEKKPKEYSYTIKRMKTGNTKYFRLEETGDNVNGVYVTEDDFPLTIRSFKENDSIHLRFGTKKLNRFFIDRKIDLIDRMSWPVVENRKKEIILIPGLGCSVSHYQPSYNLYVARKQSKT